MRLRRRLQIPRAELLVLRPEDRLVIETSARPTPDQMEDMRLQAADAFGVDETRVIIVYNATVKVLREGEAPPPLVILNPGRWP